MRTIKRILGVFLFALTLVLVAPSILPVNGNVYTVEAATKINKKKVTLIKGQTTALKITGTKKKVKWSSNKKSVATVSSKGKVTAKKKGKATITAKVGKKKLTCKVIVQTPKLSETKLNMKVGDSKTLKLFGTDQKVIWKSSDKSIANISNSGEINAKKAGTVKITATVMKKKYTCTVAVLKPNPQDEILEKIDKKFTVDSYYTSGWDKALVCTFKNNSGYDLDFGISVSFYDKKGNWSGSSWDGLNYFKNGEELVIVMDSLTFSKYDIEYTVKKTPIHIKKLYENAKFSTEKKSNGIVSYKCTNNIADGFNLDGLIVYYNSAGEIIDYNKIGWCTSGYYDIEGDFELPVNENLDTAEYSYYKVFHQIIQY